MHRLTGYIKKETGGTGVSAADTLNFQQVTDGAHGPHTHQSWGEDQLLSSFLACNSKIG